MDKIFVNNFTYVRLLSIIIRLLFINLIISPYIIYSYLWLFSITFDYF
jgi:hypothetical protein